jgi:iron complex transport system ATP-binding protein
MPTLLEVRNLSFAYQAHAVLSNVTFSIDAREVVGLVGPNGSGKSTLLRLALGLLVADRGELRVVGMPIAALSRKALARHTAFVPQDAVMEIAFTVRDVVAMGRHPHLGRFQSETPADGAAVQWALEATSTQALANRTLQELSGGERQRVILARALAQQATVLLLDEPTANLDVAHQLEMFMLVRAVVREGRCALVAIHDLALAARFCNRIIMLSEGAVVASGTPPEVITEAHLARYFRLQAKVHWEPELGGLVVLPRAPLPEPGFSQQS